jgi:hypothetical protein
MSLLTELGIFFLICFYKYSAPTALRKACVGSILKESANVEAIPGILNETMGAPLGEHSRASTNNKCDQGKMMSDNGDSKASGNKPAPRSVRIEFGRPSAFGVAIVGSCDGQINLTTSERGSASRSRHRLLEKFRNQRIVVPAKPLRATGPRSF